MWIRLGSVVVIVRVRCCSYVLSSISPLQLDVVTATVQYDGKLCLGDVILTCRNTPSVRTL